MPATISATLDAASYAPGTPMALTVTYTVPEESKVTINAVLDYVGGSIESPAITVPIKDVDVLDSESGREWVVQSDDGATAVFTATA